MWSTSYILFTVGWTYWRYGRWVWQSGQVLISMFALTLNSLLLKRYISNIFALNKYKIRVDKITHWFLELLIWCSKLNVRCIMAAMPLTYWNYVRLKVNNPAHCMQLETYMYVRKLMLIKIFYIMILLSDGKGQILFGEFVTWALEKNLDIEDDID